MRIPAIATSILLTAGVIAPAPVGRASAATATDVPAAHADGISGPFSSPASGQSPRTVRRPPVSISFAKIVLSEQTAYFYNARKRLVATVPVSTGTDDTTPTGSFRIFSKSEKTFYAPDPREKMRWMTRFTRGRAGGNIGFHSVPFRIVDGKEVPIPTPLGVAPSSHGCIRVSDSDARWIFDNMAIGTRVTVVADR